MLSHINSAQVAKLVALSWCIQLARVGKNSVLEGLFSLLRNFILYERLNPNFSFPGVGSEICL